MFGFNRYLRIRILSAEPERILTKLSQSNFELQDVIQTDLLTLELTVKQKQWNKIQTILELNGASGQVLGKCGCIWVLWSFLKRPVLAVGLAVFLLIACIAQGRILFVDVYGNRSVASQDILEEAEKCGIRFGAKTNDVRSEIVKNTLLDKFPQLQWVGITSYGSVIRIRVEERSQRANLHNEDKGVSSILSLRDGIISNMTVYQGNALVKIGQSVKKGDILVSGYTDCGIKLRAEAACGEIFAYTMHQYAAVSPVPASVKREIVKKHTCYQLRIGKKVINLCNHSGIHTTSCDKMYSEDYWNLPNGFGLPISVIKVDHILFDLTEAIPCESQEYSWMADSIRSYLGDRMVSGRILTEDLNWDVSDACCVLIGNFSCNEMIGTVKYEEILEPHAEDN